MKSSVLLLSITVFVAGVEGAVRSLSSVTRSSRLRSRSVRDLGEGSEENFEDLKVKAECDIFGTNKSYSILKDALVEAESCAEQVISSMITPETKDTKMIHTLICRLAPDLNKCYSRYAGIVADCAAPSERASVVELESSPYDFSCAKDRLLALITMDGFNCFEELKEELKQCFNNTFPAETEGADAQTLSPEQKVCKSRALQQRCVAEELKKCESPAASNFFNELAQAKGSGWSCPQPQP